MYFKFNKTMIGIVVLLMTLFIVWIGIYCHCRAKQEVCFINMRSLVSCIHVYMNDYNGRFPTSNSWCDLLKEKAKVPASDFVCPGSQKGPCSYALNKNVSVYTGGIGQSDIVFMFEAEPGWNQVGGSDLLATKYHEGRGCHIMYTDLTVEFVKKEDITSLRWE